MGKASPHYKTGRYSKDLPTQLALRATEALQNPRLLSMQDSIAVAEAHLAELMARLGTGESGARWQQCRQTLGAMVLAQQEGKWAEVETHFQALTKLIMEGAADVETWDELRQWKETLRKLAETEMKTLQSMQQMITVQQHMLMVGAQTDAVVRAVRRYTEPHTGNQILREIQAEFDRLATLEGGR